MNFIINRKTWLRGKGSIGSRLLTAEGMSCCMGQIAMQCGIYSKNILGIPVLRSCIEQDKLPSNFMEGSFEEEALWVQKGYLQNDDGYITNNIREQNLTKLFAENGHELTFVN